MKYKRAVYRFHKKELLLILLQLKKKKSKQDCKFHLKPLWTQKINVDLNQEKYENI